MERPAHLSLSESVVSPAQRMSDGAAGNPDTARVTTLITHHSATSAVLAVVALSIFAVLWFVVPWRVRLE